MSDSRIVRLESDVSALRKDVSEIKAMLPTFASKADIADLRSDVHKGIVETQRWMIATVIGLFIGFGGLFLAMTNALKQPPTPAQMQQPPIVINVPPPLVTGK